MMEKWFRIFSSVNPVEIETIKFLFTENNISFITFDNRDSSYLFGDVEFKVMAEQLDEAKKILHENDIK